MQAALRLPAEAQGVSIFEIDHPATQWYKLERIAQCGSKPPCPGWRVRVASSRLRHPCA